MRNFTVIQGDKSEKKPVDLGPHPDHQRTYEEALAGQKLMNVRPAEDAARDYWASRSSATPDAVKNDP